MSRFERRTDRNFDRDSDCRSGGESDWIFGRNPALEALRAGREVNKILLSDTARGPGIQELNQLAKEAGILVHRVPSQKIDQMAPGMRNQGVALSVAAYSYVELEDLLERAGPSPFFLILDQLEDPHNLGSILRTCDVSKVDGVIVPSRRSVGLTQVVAKTSAGAIEYVPVVRVTNLSDTIDMLKKRDVWVAGAEACEEAQDFREIDWTGPFALVIGSEGKGIRRLVKGKCDFVIQLPMGGHVNSLNASVAAGILMYYGFLMRQEAPVEAS